MQIAVYSTKPHDRQFLTEANAEGRHSLAFLPCALDATTAALAGGAPAVSLFVTDRADAAALAALSARGVRLVLLRSAGFDHVDVAAAARLGLTVARVPAYSPHSIAEHAVGLMLLLNRKLHRAVHRVREGDFSLHGLLGREMHGRVVAVIGTGGIGAATASILLGFGCRVLAHDLVPDPALIARGVAYRPLDECLAGADILTLHVPLTPRTRHLIDAEACARLRPGAMLINTSRGAVIDTAAVIAALVRGQLGALGLDVYEREAGLFFEDRSDAPWADADLSRLLTFPNVVITGHQAFFTVEALRAIAATTMAQAKAFAEGRLSGTGVVVPAAA